MPKVTSLPSSRELPPPFRPRLERRAHRESHDPPAPPPGWRPDRCCCALSAASATAGAVLRPAGSSRIADACIPKVRICSATVKRCASLHTTMGGWAPAMPAEPRRRVLQHGELAGRAPAIAWDTSRATAARAWCPRRRTKSPESIGSRFARYGTFATADRIITEAGARHLAPDRRGFARRISPACAASP